MQMITRLTRWFAKNLGVDTIRKEQVYLDLAQSLTLTDASYWIQVLFAAGIATLGLVLNSPAVIIGAMLISPWQKNFAGFADGKARSYISQLSFQESERKLVAQLQVVTSKVYTEAERSQYQQLISVKLSRPLDSIALNLT
jgi:hypothetical protein